MKKKLIALVDCDNFFVSCERLFRPDLRNKPVAVLSSNDGCIVSRSNEVKAAGIPMGAAVFKFREEVRRNKVQLFSSNFALYSDISERVMTLLKANCKEVQVYSVDEAFIVIDTEEISDPVEYGIYLQNLIKRSVGIPVSVGIGYTKTRAKLATEIAKKPQKYGITEDIKKVFNLELFKDMEKMLHRFDVQDVWGIGRQTARFLKNNFIYTVQEFIEAQDIWIKANMGITGLLKVRDLRGEHASKIRLRSQPKKGITSSRSFGKKITSFEELWNAVEYHVGHVAEKLRLQNSTTSSLRIYLYVDAPRNTNEIYSEIDKRVHSVSMGRYRVSSVATLDIATNYTPYLLAHARTCLEKIYDPSQKYKKAGVVITDVHSSRMTQLSISGEGQDLEVNEQQGKYMEVYDLLKDKYGDYVHLGTTDKGRTWLSKKDSRSPRYTTSWNEIVRISI